MQITRNSLETTPGPSEWFTGAVYLDTVRAIPPVGQQRPLHSGRANRVAHPPQRADHLRH
jgi:hypothetical protein